MEAGCGWVATAMATKEGLKIPICAPLFGKSASKSARWGRQFMENPPGEEFLTDRKVGSSPAHLWEPRYT